MTTTINASTSSGLVTTPDNSGTIALQSNGTTALTVASTGTAILGTTTNDSAAAGYVGQYVSSTVAYGSRATLTQGVTYNLTSISLTAGDWDVSSQALVEGTGATATYYYAMVAASSTNTGDIGAGLDVGTIAPLNNSIWTTTDWNIVAPLVRFSLASTTTVYLRVRAASSASGLVAWGQINARRIR